MKCDFVFGTIVQEQQEPQGDSVERHGSGADPLGESSGPRGDVQLPATKKGPGSAPLLQDGRERNLNIL